MLTLTEIITYNIIIPLFLIGGIAAAIGGICVIDIERSKEKRSYPDIGMGVLIVLFGIGMTALGVLTPIYSSVTYNAQITPCHISEDLGLVADTSGDLYSAEPAIMLKLTDNQTHTAVVYQEYLRRHDQIMDVTGSSCPGIKEGC